jgi:hypothetical protein
MIVTAAMIGTIAQRASFDLAGFDGVGRVERTGEPLRTEG